LSKSVIT